MLTALLTRARDNRLVWDLLGPIYNRNIYGALHELYGHIAEGLDLTDGARVLDVGTGPGYAALHVAKRHPSSTVFGIDFSPMQVRAAERRRRRRGIGNCSFTKANAMQLPFDSGSFGAAVSVGSIKHWPDACRGLREMGRVLRPGGQLCIAETDRDVSDEEFRRFLARFSIWYIWGPLLAWGTRRIVFGKSYSEVQVVSFMEEAGFSGVRAERLEGCPYVIVKAAKT
ncbi:MAG TPA: methyltransferase domain-containing protein [Deltaproteobacteria bacterium]|nr:methyltransferase domain-containing protein [Deltaproteobacteria bacterium]HPR55348.1 methyltransferase domain-containing protein [Deltaproteobacteria bacterium]HXK48543.1 methyltransferase domain-containing protein [Deltaproteobacteria bacterium]